MVSAGAGGGWAERGEGRTCGAGGRWREGAAGVGATAAGGGMERAARERPLRPGAPPQPPPPQGEARAPLRVLHIKVEEPELAGAGDPGCCGDSGGAEGEFRRSPALWAGIEEACGAIKREGDHGKGSGGSRLEVAVLEKRGSGKEPWRGGAIKAELPDAAFEAYRVKVEKDAPAGSLCGPVRASADDRKAQLCEGFGILPEDVKIPVVFHPLPPGTRIQIQGPLPPELIHVTKVPVKQVPLKMQSLLEPSVKIETKNVPLTVLPSDSGIILRELGSIQ